MISQTHGLIDLSNCAIRQQMGMRRMANLVLRNFLGGRCKLAARYGGCWPC